MIIKIEDYPDYLISSDGDVYSIYTLNRFGKYIRKKPFKLNPSLGNNGYCSVMLGSKLNHQAKRLSVHRLVAISFIPNPENKRFVNHKDGNKLNNKVSNLEWVTQSENEIHAHKTGLKNFKSDKNPARKISSLIAEEIRSLHSKGNITQVSIANIYGIDQSTVSYVINKKTWA